jgi:uncharacterized membrane-anchored protein
MSLGPSTRVLVALAVAAQLAVLAWMAGEREWIFRTGQVVYLRTAPVDPRDLFRGDFVRLQYEINSVRGDDVAAAAQAKSSERRRHEVVYTRLQPAGEGLYEAVATGTTRPADGIFIRGRTDDAWRLGWRGPEHVIVRYGIEQLFIEQGSGHAIEERRGRRDGLQVPMEVEVALSTGTAVIRGYRWSRLGMKLGMLRRPAPRRPNAPPPEGPLSPKLRLTLANASDAPLAIVDFGEHCTFHLVPAEWGPAVQVPATTGCSAAKPSAVDVITLAPGQAHSVELDLAEPRWHVRKDDKTVEIGALPGLAQFRIEYRAPEVDTLPAAAAAVWRGRMASQSFNASGIVD